jgi:hypothetical protein
MADLSGSYLGERQQTASHAFKWVQHLCRYVVVQAQEHVAGGLQQLATEREDFERHREKQEAELEARWTELRYGGDCTS